MTQDVFDRIAPSWYNFRHWSIFRNELEMVSARWQRGTLLNIGCAHGPDFLPFRQNFDLYGVDFSIQMLAFAQKYSEKFKFSVNLALADARYLPFGSTELLSAKPRTADKVVTYGKGTAMARF